MNSNGKKSDFTFDRITEFFYISKGLVIKTMGTVTRMCSRNAANIPMNRRYTTNDRMLWYTRILEDLFMDTMFAAKGKKNKKGIVMTRTDSRSVRANSPL